MTTGLMDSFHCFKIRSFLILFRVMCLSAVSVQFYFISPFLCTALPVFCHNKAAVSLFHLKNGKGNEGGERKALHHSFSHLKEAGIRKFLTIKNSLVDLRQEKAGKIRTAICRSV